MKLDEAINKAGSFEELFDEFMARDEFSGFGYLGERQRFRTTTDEDQLRQCSKEDREELVQQADLQVYVAMKIQDYDAKQAFEWLNGKDGRYYADSYFGTFGKPQNGYKMYLP